MMKKLLFTKFHLKLTRNKVCMFAFLLTAVSFSSFGQAVTQNFTTPTANSVGAVEWTANTAYSQFQYVYSSASSNLYRVYTAGTSTSTPPTGTATGSSSIVVGAAFEYMGTIPATQTWTCPQGVTSIDVEVWGAGGGGGGVSASSATGTKAAGGGGAGSYLKNTYTVVPGNSYTIIVGTGGYKGSTSSALGFFGAAGGKSEFSGSGVTTLAASGGTGGSGAGSAHLLGPGGVLGGVYGFSISGTKTTSYTNPGTVTITGGGGTGAAAISNGTTVSYIGATNQGTGYTSVPTVTVGPAGAGQTFTAIINPNVNSSTYTTLIPGINGGDGTATKGGDGGTSQAGAGGVGGYGTTSITGAGVAATNIGSGGSGAYSYWTGTASAGSGSGGSGANGKVAISYNAPITTYTYTGGDLHNVSNWKDESTSTTSPANFTADFQIFKVSGNVITTAAWTVSGASSKIVVGDAANAAASLTIATGFPITGTVDLAAASSGSNSLIIQDPTLPTFGSLDATSEVHLQQQLISTTVNSVTTLSSPSLILGSASFGKLFVDGNSSVLFSTTSTPTIKTAFTLTSGSTLTISGNSTNYMTINVGAIVTLNGYLKGGKAAGLFSYAVSASNANNGSIQFVDAMPTLTIGASSTVEYSRNNAGSTQIISKLPNGINYGNLTISDGGVVCNKTFESAAITISGALTINQTASTLTLGNSITLNSPFTLTDNTTIALGTAANVSFAASQAASWTSGKTLTITGWTGTAGTSGTAGKLFFGSTTSNLTAQQISQIAFNISGTNYSAMLLSDGELVPTNTVLPVKLTSFAATKQGAAVQLKWSTASEQNNARFDVQRSTDGQSFTTIGSKAGAGNSNTVLNYFFTDYTPLSGVNYYRLNQLDLDGKSTLSNPVAIDFGFELTNMVVYTAINPSTLNVNIKAEKASTGKFVVYNIAGQKMLEKVVSLNSGNNEMGINLPDLRKGIYVATYQNGSQLLTQKFIR